MELQARRLFCSFVRVKLLTIVRIQSADSWEHSPRIAPSEPLISVEWATPFYAYKSNYEYHCIDYYNISHKVTYRRIRSTIFSSSVGSLYWALSLQVQR